jgi:DNA primase
MPLIPEGAIDEIQARADIAELIGRYVPLKRAGRHFKANCPFHKEKTPSFHVNTDKQIFHCFGCGVGGNIFSFLMQHDRLTFPEAVRQMAEQVGVPIPESAGNDESRRAQDAAAALLEKACQFFERTLQDPAQGRQARAYLQQRGVSEETSRRFRLGLAPDGWRQLTTKAKAAGLAPAELESAGLVIKGRAGPYDRFRHRLIFPVCDVRGRVIGFGGRSLGDETPKYLNSPETPLFTKGRHLFGLAQAKDAVVRGKTAVVVEGYFDCVVLAGEGFAHVVSPLGTALTPEHARLLKRYAETVILAFDPDAAGEQATLRGIDLLVEAGLQVRVAQLPAGVDPDEYVRSRGREQLAAVLDRSPSLFEFLMETAKRRHPGRGVEERGRAAQFVLPTIAKVPDAILRTEYTRALADQLRLAPEAVAEELAKAAPRGTAAATPAPQRKAPAPQGPEQLLVALVLDEPARWQSAGGLTAADVTDPSLRRILQVIEELAAAGQASSAAAVISRLEGPSEAATVSALVELARTVGAKDAAWRECVERLARGARRRHLSELQEQIRTAQEAGHEDEVHVLLNAYQHELVQGGTP